MNLKDTAMARAFALGKLHFSEKLTAATVNAYLAMQRFARNYETTCKRLAGDVKNDEAMGR